MYLKYGRVRHGISSLFEAVACVALASLLVVALLSIMASTTVATMETQLTIEEKINSDFFIESLQTDIKSSLMMETTDNTQLHLVLEDRVILYRTDENTIYRNDEVALTDIKSCTFVSEDGDTVGIYITRKYDEIIDITISR